MIFIRFFLHLVRLILVRGFHFNTLRLGMRRTQNIVERWYLSNELAQILKVKMKCTRPQGPYVYPSGLNTCGHW